MRRDAFVLFCVIVALLGLPSARAEVPIVVFDGRGWGHGVGLSQWGAEYQARQGASTPDILAGFYPGTQLEEQTGQVRVSVYTSPNSSASLAFPSGGEIRSSLGGAQASGFPVRIAPGGSVRIDFNGSYEVTPLVGAQSAGEPVIYNSSGERSGCIPLVNCPTTTTTTAPPSGGGGGGGGGCVILCGSTTTTRPPTTTTAPSTGGGPTPTTAANTTSTAPSSTQAPADDGPVRSSNPVWAVPSGGGATTALDRGRSYRGVIEATARSGPLRLLNQLDVETYLKGMGEVPGSWPVAAIGAQAVVARTYALRAMSFSGELCDYDLCQVYIGVSKESAGQSAAVEATRGQVLTYGGQLASTVYSADAGGVSATTFEGFGTPDGVYPYLTTIEYETDNPLPWRTEIAMSDLASRFGYPGTVTDVTVSDAGPSGRALTVTLSGDAGDQQVDGRRFSSKLGLRSTLWERTLTTADAPPPPPPSYDFVQALPEDVEAITAAATQGEEAAIAAAETELDMSGVIAAVIGVEGLADEAVDVASRPATLFALFLIAAMTALGMSRWGLQPVGPNVVGPQLRTRTASVVVATTMMLITIPVRKKSANLYPPGP